MFRTKQDQFNPIKVRCELKKKKEKRVNIFPFVTFIRNLRVKIDHSPVSGVKSAHLKQMCSQSDTDWVAVAMLIPEPGILLHVKRIVRKGRKKEVSWSNEIIISWKKRGLLQTLQQTN